MVAISQLTTPTLHKLSVKGTGTTYRSNSKYKTLLRALILPINILTMGTQTDGNDKKKLSKQVDVRGSKRKQVSSSH